MAEKKIKNQRAKIWRIEAYKAILSFYIFRTGLLSSQYIP